MSKAIHYLTLFYHGNPAAFWLIIGFLILSVFAVWITPICDAEFDAYMQQYEEAKALNEDLRRAA